MSETLPHTFKNQFVIKFFKDNDGFIDIDTFMERCIQKYHLQMESPNITVTESPLLDRVEISKNELNQMHMEYKFFVEKRETFSRTLRDFTHESHSILNQVKFTEMNRIMSRHGNSDLDVPIFTCELCKTFSVTTKKGIATHMRKCRRNFEISSAALEIENKNVDIDASIEV